MCWWKPKFWQYCCWTICGCIVSQSLEELMGMGDTSYSVHSLVYPWSCSGAFCFLSLNLRGVTAFISLAQVRLHLNWQKRGWSMGWNTFIVRTLAFEGLVTYWENKLISCWKSIIFLTAGGAGSGISITAAAVNTQLRASEGLASLTGCVRPSKKLMYSKELQRYDCSAEVKGNTWVIPVLTYVCVSLKCCEIQHSAKAFVPYFA